MATQVSLNTGSYQLACEKSVNKLQIDSWLNEGKPLKWISDRLGDMGDYISVNSIVKYKKYRDEIIKKELEADPLYQAKQTEITEQFNMSVAKVQKVDMIGQLSNMIEHSAELLTDARSDDIRINNIKDMRMVQQTMLEAIQVYGDTMLKAQQYSAIENDPSILKGGDRTTININVKTALADILRNAVEEGGNNGFGIIDAIRNGIGNTNQ